MENNIKDIRIKIFARECMGIVTDEEYVEWAMKELLSGNESYSILILAGLVKPLNRFEINDYKEKSKKELGIEIDNASIVHDYARLLARLKLDGKIDSKTITHEMIEILKYTDYDKKYYAWFNIDEFFDDYYIISKNSIDEEIDKECREILGEDK
jgi:hypothetical protein